MLLSRIIVLHSITTVYIACSRTINQGWIFVRTDFVYVCSVAVLLVRVERSIRKWKLFLMIVNISVFHNFIQSIYFKGADFFFQYYDDIGFGKFSQKNYHEIRILFKEMISIR